MKLKTINDIEKCVTCTSVLARCVNIHKLKEEAIKHIKNNANYEFLPDVCPKCKTSISFPDGEIHHLEGPGCDYYTETWKEFIKYFFNIRESELL